MILSHLCTVKSQIRLDCTSSPCSFNCGYLQSSLIGTPCNALYFFHSISSGVKNKARCVIKVCEKWILAKFCSGSLPGGHSGWSWTLASNLWHWSGCLATFKGQDTTAGWQFGDFLKVSSLLFWFWWREIQKIRQGSLTLWGKKLVLHEILWLF